MSLDAEPLPDDPPSDDPPDGSEDGVAGAGGDETAPDVHPLRTNVPASDNAAGIVFEYMVMLHLSDRT